MEQVLSDDLWKDLRARAKKAKKKRAAIAYVSKNHLSLGRGDILVVDASDGVIKSQGTSAELLTELDLAGVTIYSLPGLHAKVALLDSLAVVGSANSSPHSEDSLIEASLVTDSPFIVARVQQLINDWMDEAGDALTKRQLKRLVDLPKEKKTWQPGTTKKRGKTKHRREQAVWVTRVNDLREDAHPNEADWVEKGLELAKKSSLSNGDDITWIRYPSLTSTFERQVMPGDLVIQVWKPLGSERFRVLPPVTLLKVREEPTCFRMFLEEAPLGMEEMAFARFTAMAKKAGITRPIGKNSSRELKRAGAEALFEAWRAASKG